MESALQRSTNSVATAGITPKNIFYVGLDDFHRRSVESMPIAAECRFHTLLDHREVRGLDRDVNVEELLDKARRQLDDFKGSVDGICTYWDFPSSCMVPILCGERGLPSASLEAVLKCEHKYWSLLEQRKVVPNHVPRFQAVDPFDEASIAAIDLPYPYWLKPVKSVNAYLGFKIEDERDLEVAIGRIRRGIQRIAEPFNSVLRMVDLPPEVRGIDGRFCIASENIAAPRQCTAEGWCFGGETTVYGVVDSVRFPGTSTFSRYEYPSTLPKPVLDRIHHICHRVMTQIGYCGSPFNIEFFWDEKSDRLSLLEVNSRISQSHSRLFNHVDGAPNHLVAVELALGRRPSIPYREGKNPVAAKFYLRSFEDGTVVHAPDEAAVERISREIPDVSVQVTVSEGVRLSELKNQESYSFELAWIYVGAQNHDELMDKFERCKELLGIRIEPTRDSAA